MKSRNLIWIIAAVLILASPIFGGKVIRGWGYGTLCSGQKDISWTITYDYSSLTGYLSDGTEDSIYLVRWDPDESRWYPVKGALKDKNLNKITATLNRCKEGEQWALAEEDDPCDGINNDGDANIDEGYCGAPIYTEYDGGASTTDLSNKGRAAHYDYSLVSSLTLEDEVVGTKVVWSGDVDVIGENYDANINMGTDFVSLNVENLDNTIDTSATVTLSGVDCTNLVLYHANGFYTNLNDIKTNGGVCNTGTTPACNLLSCNGGVASFTVTSFDSFGGEGSGGGPTPIPEFSTIVLFLAIILTVLGVLIIIRKK